MGLRRPPPPLGVCLRPLFPRRPLSQRTRQSVAALRYLAASLLWLPPQIRSAVAAFPVAISSNQEKKMSTRNTAAGNTNGRGASNGRQRAQALDMALRQIEKNFGKGSIMRLGERAALQMETVSTGALALDLALGIGGLPRGRVTEVFGPESSGKTTLALHVVAEAQRTGGLCAFIDAEHALDPVYARAIGVDVDALLLSQPDTGEQALEIADVLIRSGAIDVVVVDSVAALTPRAEIEGEIGDSHVGLQARLMSQALRKLSANISKTNSMCIFINQLREKIGVMFGSPETTPGGRALKFFSSVRLDIRRIESIKNGAEVVGNRTRVRVVKNKTAPPFRTAEFDIMYSKGISREGSVLDLGVKFGIVAKSGAWFTYEGDHLGQGRENVKDYLRENPALLLEITEKVRSQVMPQEPQDGEVEEPGANKSSATEAARERQESKKKAVVG